MSNLGYPPRDVAAGVHAAAGCAGAQTQAAPPAECEATCAHHRPVRLSWAKLLKRVFEIDMAHCPNYGGELKIISAILEHPVIEKIPTHLGLRPAGPGTAARASPSAAPNPRMASVGVQEPCREAFGNKKVRLAQDRSNSKATFSLVGVFLVGRWAGGRKPTSSLRRAGREPVSAPHSHSLTWTMRT